MAGPALSLTARRCPLCGITSVPHSDRCLSCGLSAAEAQRGRRLRRIAVIVIGIALQLLMGLLLWMLPPGTVLGWLMYIALGVVGVMHIIAGSVGFGASFQPEGALAITAVFEPDDLPYHAKLCPQCCEPLAEAIGQGRRRCPACDSPFNMRELGWRQADPAGEPATLSPHEMRMGGGALVALVIGAIAFVIIAGMWSAGVLP